MNYSSLYDIFWNEEIISKIIVRGVILELEPASAL